MTYLGEPRQFSVTQLTAMYLGKLRDIASNELKTGVSDIVITVPGWFTDIQRRALLDAAQIAGLNCLRLINDTTAVALGYGITKSDLPEPENPRHVVFVDVGHSSTSASVVAFSKGRLDVKATAYDRHAGGRDIDYALVQHFAAEFKEKYKIDVLSSPKATFRLAAGCDKVKKVLSANAEAPLNVESIMNDIDATSRLTREEYEKLIAGVLDRIPGPIQQALADSGLTLEQIDAIELVGGCTRIPAVRAKIQSVLEGKVLSTTLNQDEAAARGATFSCAMLSPIFRVREFSIHDITPYSIKFHWERQPDETDDDTELLVFPKGNGVPSTKALTFYRKQPFDIEATYAEPSALPGGINPWIARFTAKNVGPNEKGDHSTVRVRTRLNQHGVLSFEQTYIEVEVEEEEQPMQVDGEPEQQPKKKKKVKKIDVPFVWGSTSLDPSVLEKFKEQEAEMHAADKLVMDTEVSFPGHLALHGVILTCCYRTAKTPLRSTSTTCVVVWMSATPPTSRLMRRRRFSRLFRKLRTGSTARRARTRRSLRTLRSSTLSRSSAIRSRTATRRQSSGRASSASCVRPSTGTCPRRRRRTRSTRTSTRRTSSQSSRSALPSRSGSRTRLHGSLSVRKTLTLFLPPRRYSRRRTRLSTLRRRSLRSPSPSRQRLIRLGRIRPRAVRRLPTSSSRPSRKAKLPRSRRDRLRWTSIRASDVTI